MPYRDKLFYFSNKKSKDTTNICSSYPLIDLTVYAHEAPIEQTNRFGIYDDEILAM